jgi:hypothetical protein
MQLSHPKKLFPLLKKTLILTLYLAAWLCTLNFYNHAVLHLDVSPYGGYTAGIILAGILAKFIIFEQTVFPITFKEGSSLYGLIFRRTTQDTMVALFLRYIFAGIEGLFNHQGFVESMQSLGGGDFIHILAIWMLFWLVIMPYMVYRCLCIAVGVEKIHALFDRKIS